MKERGQGLTDRRRAEVKVSLELSGGSSPRSLQRFRPWPSSTEDACDPSIGAWNFRQYQTVHTLHSFPHIHTHDNSEVRHSKSFTPPAIEL